MPTFTRAARAAAQRLLADANDPEACLACDTSPRDDTAELRCRRPCEWDTVEVVDGLQLIAQSFPGASTVLDFPARTDGGFRILRERDELELTPAAKEAAQMLLAASDDINACLRFNAHVGSGNCSWRKSIDVSPPHWQDQVFLVCGMKMVVDPRSASYLIRYVVDWSETDQKFTFTPRTS